jgi:hypothetical protein
MRVAVRPDETVEIAMNDRNTWMTGARQEAGSPVAPRPPTTGKDSQNQKRR